METQILQKMICLESKKTTSNSIHLLQNTGGLFNTVGEANDVNGLVTSLGDSPEPSSVITESIVSSEPQGYATLPAMLGSSLSELSPLEDASEGIFDFHDPKQEAGVDSFSSTSPPPPPGPEVHLHPSEDILGDETMEGFADLTQFILDGRVNNDFVMLGGESDSTSILAPLTDSMCEVIRPSTMNPVSIDNGATLNGLKNDSQDDISLMPFPTISMESILPTTSNTDQTDTSPEEVIHDDLDLLLASVSSVDTVVTESSPPVSTRKRKACPAFTSQTNSMHTVMTSADSNADLGNINDHQGYTIKRVKKSKVNHQQNDLNEDPVPSTSTCYTKEQKYRERRDKNNVASKRSREVRKQKYKQMEEEGNILEEKNKLLIEQITRMEKEIKVLKDHLVKNFTEKKPSA